MMKKISFTVDSQTLRGTLHFPKKLQQTNPSILFIHGWASNETGYYPRAKALTEKGYICLSFNLRGHGTSDGNLSELSPKNHLRDVLAAYDFLAGEKGIDRKKISAVGASYGAFLITILTSKREVYKIALRAPALFYNKNFTMQTEKIVKDREETLFQKFHPDKNNFALSAIKHFTGDILLIESQKDQIIPHQILQFYAKAANSVKSRGTHLSHKVIHNADHQLSRLKWKKTFITYLTDWY